MLRVSYSRHFSRGGIPHFAIRLPRGWYRAIPTEIAKRDVHIPLSLSAGARVIGGPPWLGFTPTRVICIDSRGFMLNAREITPSRVIPLSLWPSALDEPVSPRLTISASFDHPARNEYVTIRDRNSRKRVRGVLQWIIDVEKNGFTHHRYARLIDDNGDVRIVRT